VTFLSDSMDPAVLSALCTRNGGEANTSPPDGWRADRHAGLRAAAWCGCSR